MKQMAVNHSSCQCLLLPVYRNVHSCL